MGIIHAVSLLTELYLRAGSKVIMEDPTYPLARQVFENAGAEIISCPVDKDGLVVGALPKRADEITFLYLTPSHQFPTGGRLSIERRIQIIDWASANGVIVLEDDYDGEYRYDVPPLPPLAALPNDCVVYLGTFSKTLYPGIRVGYVIAPETLIETLARARSIREYDQPGMIQQASADFIEAGHFEKHIQRMSRLYREKRQVVAKSIRELAIPGTLTGLDSGLHCVLKLDGAVDAARVSRSLLGSGVAVPPLSRFYAKGRVQDCGLVIGYAAPSVGQSESGMASMAEHLSRV